MHLEKDIGVEDIDHLHPATDLLAEEEADAITLLRLIRLKKRAGSIKLV